MGGLQHEEDAIGCATTAVEANGINALGNVGGV